MFGAQARFRRDAVTIAGRSAQYVRVGDEGGRVTFNFCPDCGATVHYSIEAMESYVAIPVGAFADSTFPAPMISVHEECKHGWVVVPSDMEHIG